jgi:predicted ATPase
MGCSFDVPVEHRVDPLRDVPPHSIGLFARLASDPAVVDANAGMSAGRAFIDRTVAARLSARRTTSGADWLIERSNRKMGVIQ